MVEWGSPVEIERRRRILVSAWAYAYEVDAAPIVDDQTYDEWASQIDVSIDTGRPDLDHFFRTEFGPETGMWIHKHPERQEMPRLLSLMRIGTAEPESDNLNGQIEALRHDYLTCGWEPKAEPQQPDLFEKDPAYG